MCVSEIKPNGNKENPAHRREDNIKMDSSVRDYGDAIW